MLFVDTAHKRSSWRQDLIHEDEDGFLWAELDSLPDNVDELSNCEICRYKVLLLVDGCNVGFFYFLANNLRQIDG